MKKSESKETTPPVQKSTPKATAISSLVGGYESSESEDEAESTTVPQPKSTIKSLVAYDDSFANDGCKFTYSWMFVRFCEDLLLVPVT